MDSLTNTLGKWLNSPEMAPIMVLLVWILIALVVRLFISRVVVRWTHKTKSDLDDRLVATFQNPITLALFAVGIWQTARMLLPDSVGSLVHNGLATLVIFIWVVAILRFGHYLIGFLSSDPERYKLFTPRTRPLFQMILKIFVIIGAIYIVLLVWNQDVTAWLASAGIIGIAIGFAAKDTLANFFSGIFILADAPYKIGDYIVLVDGTRGRITDIGIRSTRMLTRDDVEIIVPNAVIGNSQVVNQSGGPYEMFRLRVPFSVAYGSDIDRVRELVMNLAGENELVVRDPVHRLRFRALGDSGLEFELLCWVEKPELRGRAMDLLLTAIYKTFHREGIEIPYPKRDVYLHYPDPSGKAPISATPPTEDDPSKPGAPSRAPG